MSMSKTLDDLKFEEKDCTITGATRTVSGKQVPVIYGVPSANIRDGRQMTEREVNAITVFHHPTGIFFTADSGGPQVNRQTALDQVRRRVEQMIKDARNASAEVTSTIPGS